MVIVWFGWMVGVYRLVIMEHGMGVYDFGHNYLEFATMGLFVLKYNNDLF